MKYFVEKILQQKKRKNHLPESRRTASSSRAVLPLRRRGPARVRRSTAHPVPRAAADPPPQEPEVEAGGAAHAGPPPRRSPCSTAAAARRSAADPPPQEPEGEAGGAARGGGGGRRGWGRRDARRRMVICAGKEEGREEKGRGEEAGSAWGNNEEGEGAVGRSSRL